MTKIKSPIKQKLDATTGQSLVQSYAAGLKGPQPTEAWDVLGGMGKTLIKTIEEQRAEREAEKENKKLELEAYEDQYAQNAEIITGNAGSLGEEYYNLAFGEAKQLQEQYAQAVQSGDKKLQGELRMKLNGLSTGVQTLKQSLEIAAEMKSDAFGESALSNGRTPEEILITATCTDPANLSYVDGEWKWKNPKYDPQSEGSKEFFSIEDLNSSLVVSDEQTSASYIEHENSMNLLGKQWADGVDGSEDLNEDRMTTANRNFVNQNNIMSVMHDDFRKTGMDNTFANNLNEYLQGINYADLGLDVSKWDKDGDNDVDADDFALEEDRELLFKAITDKTNPNYDFETSRGIVAGWMTSFQKKVFYGNAARDDNGNFIVPGPGETAATFKAKGGILGPYMQGDGLGGMVYNVDEDAFVSQTKDPEELLKKLD